MTFDDLALLFFSAMALSSFALFGWTMMKLVLGDVRAEETAAHRLGPAVRRD